MYQVTMFHNDKIVHELTPQNRWIDAISSAEYYITNKTWDANFATIVDDKGNKTTKSSYSYKMWLKSQ